MLLTYRKNKVLMNNIFKLVIAIVISESAGIIGAVFTMPAISGWYTGLVKPEFAPSKCNAL